jgi:UDP-N-acetylmuramoyl-tripeptide--D-alanyl-D-alanine ligase
MSWTVRKIAETLRRDASAQSSEQRIAGFSIDSRTLQPQEAFIAIKGPNHDGHDFVPQALERGAALALVGEERRATYPSPMQRRLLSVPDPFQALQQLGLFARRAWGGPVIGVTGSTGKTTTKEMLSAILASCYRVLKSEGNLNNEYGVPLTLLRLEEKHELVVLEMAMAHKGELAKLCAVAEPNVGLVTNVAPVHLEFFSSVEEIAAAKRELILGLVPPGVAVLNADDQRVSRFAEGFAGQVHRFAINQPAEVRAENVNDRGCLGSEFDLVTGSARARVRLSLPGRAHVGNALAAFATASLQGIGPAEAARVLAGMEAAPLRGRLVAFVEGFTVVNDAYNSNPHALGVMVEALSRTPGAQRRILVAGEMKELGTTSADLHRAAGETIARLERIDLLAGVTGDTRRIVEGAIAGGMSEERARFFETKEAAADWLSGTLQAGDWVLLKASRGVGLETVLDSLQSRFVSQEDSPALSSGAPAQAGRGEG